MIFSLVSDYEARNTSIISHPSVFYLGVSSGPIAGEYADEVEMDDTWFPVIHDMAFEVLWGKLYIKAIGVIDDTYTR